MCSRCVVKNKTVLISFSLPTPAAQQNEARSYWGVLSREGEGGEKGKGDGLIKCEGSILVGLALEPTSIGQFRLLEVTANEEEV